MVRIETIINKALNLYKLKFYYFYHKTTNY